jgi:O-antigen/teichoic acid export membrane protein
LADKKFFSKIKDISTLGVANVIPTVIGGLFWFYIASLIDVDQYGEINYIIAIAGIAGVISYLGSTTTITVYSAKGLDVIPAIVVLVLIFSSIASLVIFIFIQDLGATIYVLGFVIFGIILADIIGKKLYKNYAIYSILQRILMVIFSITLYYLIGYHGIVLGISLSFLPFSIKLYQTVKGHKLDFALLKINKNFIVNNYVLDLAKTFSGSADKLIIGPLFGFIILGNYQLGIQFLALLIIIPHSVFQYVLPHDATGQLNTKIKKFAIIISVIMAAVGVVFAPVVLSSLFPKFTNADEIVRIVSLTIIPMTINLMYISEFLGKLQSNLVLKGSVIFIGIQILGIIILGNLFGVNGIAWSLVLASTAESCYLFSIARYYKSSTKNLNQ